MGGGQAVGVPLPLHPGFGGIHNAEKLIGAWGKRCRICRNTSEIY
ncbi:hypothetical protein P4K82_04430 [Bacillus cereus]|nr:hypothetical protein [Bacillus cereus]